MRIGFNVKYFKLLNLTSMKLRSIVVTFATSLAFFSCKKEAIKIDTQATEVASAKASNTGNIRTRVMNNTLNFPWEILWAPDNSIWFTEREGRVMKMNPETGAVTLIATISEVASTTNFNGLLGMALHPQFDVNPFVFLIYNYFDAAGNYLQKIVRFTYNGSTLMNPMTLLDGIQGKIGGDFIHNGSRLVIGADMKLYASTGDANQRFQFPQNPEALNGKILRINLDGSIPADNPFHNAVWTIGHRNAQGLVFALGRLYSSEHGETTNDEINIIERGRNYGWPFVEGICDLPAERTFCAANNIKEPIYTWTPTVAPSGTEFYNSTEISQWRNSLLVTFLKDKRLRQMQLNETGTAIESVHEFFVNQFGRLRDIAISPDGKVYLCTDNGNNADMIIEVTKGK
jgi:aldose sugar dehydrogenase